MLRKTLLTTSALMVAGSMALAGQNGPPRRAHALAQIQQLHRDALIKKGMILDRKGVPIAISRMPASPAGNGADGKALQPPLFGPGKRDSYSNFSKSKNALYLSWFGWFVRDNTIHSGPYSGSFCYSYSGSKCVNYYKYKDFFSETFQQSAAAPFPALKSASSIALAVATYSAAGGGKVGIYSNHIATTSSPCATPSGAPSCPGKPIRGASGTFNAPSPSGYCCADVVTVNFSPVNLRKKATQYWVVASGNGTGNGILWYTENSNLTQFGATGEDYKYTTTEIIDDTYHTTRYGTQHSTYKTTLHTSSNGWLHTAGFTHSDGFPTAFSINQPP